MAEIEPSAVVHHAQWRDIDFSCSKFGAIGLVGCHIENCLFEECDIQGARIWSSRIRNSSFKHANLRDAVLGGVREGVRNEYFGVDFSNADLSRTTYKAAAFEQCLFSNAKLVKIDFQSSTFVDCRFEGELNDVLFYRHGFEGKHFPPNEMVNVDFRRARLHDVSFRGLLLDRVCFPEDAEHVVIKDFASSLDQMSAALKGQEDTTAKRLIGFIRIYREVALPNQAQGVINLKDLEEVVGEEGVKRFLALIPEGARRRPQA